MQLATQAIGTQSETDRLRARAVWLYHVEGCTQNDIATQLGINRVMVVRLLADARRRNEVRVTISAPLAELVELERAIENRYGIARVIIAPFSDPDEDPVKVIAAAAGNFISGLMKSGMTVGVGWGRTLYNTLPFISGATLIDFRVVSLLGGIAAARRFNPAEFAWQFAELFQGEGFLIPAPAVVDSPETKHAFGTLWIGLDFRDGGKAGRGPAVRWRDIDPDDQLPHRIHHRVRPPVVDRGRCGGRCPLQLH
jgi:deoxyribonucleoside regulator